METLTGREGGQGFRYVLARTDFRLVWFAQLASQSADKFVMFSLIILAYNLSGANTQVAVTLLAYTVPALFLPPFGGFAVGGGLVALASIPRNKPRLDHNTQSAFRQFVHEIREALDFLRGSSLLMFAFAQLTLTVLVLFMMFTLAPAYVTTVIGIQPRDSYVILLPATLGAVTSAFVVGQFGRSMSRARLLVVSLLMTGFTLLLLASVPYGMRHLP